MTKAEELLTNYRTMKRTFDLLTFRINYFSGLSEDHVIEELTFTTPEDERVSTSGVSDKTSRIAFNYETISYEQGKEILESLISRQRKLKNELSLVDYCLTLLDQELSDIAIDLFVNGMDWDSLCNKYHISRPTLGRYRQKIVQEISKMFDDGMIRAG